MSERHFTAAKIVEDERAYWAAHKDYLKKLNEMLDYVSKKVLDIVFGRVRGGWPTREDAAPEEEC